MMKNSERKKLVFITARLPYPASSGRKNVMYNYCKIMHDVYGYDITVISFLEDGDAVDPKPEFIKDVIQLPHVSGKRKIINLCKYTLIKRLYPMQVSLYYEPKCQILIDEVLKRVSPKVVITDMVRTTEYAREYSGYKIADLDDMLSIRYERQMKMDMSTINPYGAYLYSLPGFIQKVLSLRILKRLILSNEVKLLRRYEHDISKVYDKTIFVAEREAEILNQEIGFNKALGVPLGVDADFFGEFYGKIQPNAHTIAFLGAMSVAHNEAGAIHFIRDILPLVVKRIPDAKFVVVGGGITEKLKNVAKGNPAVVFTGRVDDVRTAVGKCEVFVCPLTFGSGIKTKNLEAMAMGVPVVTTSIGAENINAVHEKEWLIADDEQMFADQVIRLMTDTILHDSIKVNAKDFVENNFTWKVAEERLKQCI